MAYSTARYRAAIRKAKRARRGGRIPAWAWVAGAVAAAVMFTGSAGKVIHDITGPAAATTVAAPSAKVDKAVAFARAQIGCPYQWGGLGPCSSGFDCSGLVYEAYKAAHVTIPRTTFGQWPTLHHVTDPHKGDLVFFAGSDGTTTSPGHVGLVLGPHRMIDAYSTGYPITVESFGLPTSRQGLTNPVGYARPVPLAHTTVTVAARGSYTPGSWARALLHDGGYPVTSCNVGAVIAWEAAEGGNWANAAKFNPLNDKRPEPGSGPAVGDVQEYASWGSGLTATEATLSGPDYGSIRAALKAGSNAQAVADAVGASVWGTQNFTAEC